LTTMLSECRRVAASFIVFCCTRSTARSFVIVTYKQQQSLLQTPSNFVHRYPSRTMANRSSNDDMIPSRTNERDDDSKNTTAASQQEDSKSLASKNTSRKRKNEATNDTTNPSGGQNSKMTTASSSSCSSSPLGGTAVVGPAGSNHGGGTNNDAVAARSTAGLVAAVPSCYCSIPACRQTVQKDGPNHGRKFWSCANWRNADRCKFFEWQEDDNNNNNNAAAMTHPKRLPNSAAAAAASTYTTTTTAKNTKHGNVATSGGGTTAALAIKLVTFNVAEFKRHSQAPPGFDPRRAFLEELKLHQPDILALQELPPEDDHQQCSSSFSGYQCVGTTPSHCGLVGLFIRSAFLQEAQASFTRVWPPAVTNGVDMMAGDRVPAVLAYIAWQSTGVALVVSSCHLEPFKEGKKVRAAQLQAIAKAATLKYNIPATRMILAGDMNMRQAEDAAVEKLLGQDNWTDAWKQAGSSRQEAYTWDSSINHYHGMDAFQFHCRFDRVYLYNVKIVQSFQLMANKPMSSSSSTSNDPYDSPNRHGQYNYYLSDHFGIVTTLLI
jgi:endonuclease/exonuclease/phosphatase family metal-dependent hydrolase